MTNEGYNPEEIKLLREECEEEGMNFVHCDDEDESMAENDELAHVQFVGEYKGQEVIYDAIIYTLRLHHSSLVYEKAVAQAQKVFPKYLPLDERGPGYKIKPEEEEEAEELITEPVSYTHLDVYKRQTKTKVVGHDNDEVGTRGCFLPPSDTYSQH